MEFFKIFSFLWKGLQISLLTSSQPPPDIKSKSSYGRKRDYAQIWKFSPRLPKMEFFKKTHFFEKVSRFRFQRALNHPQKLSLSQVMQENMLSKKLNLGFNFSTPSGGVTSPSLKGSMLVVVLLVQVHYIIFNRALQLLLLDVAKATFK